MKKTILYQYLGTNGTICSPVHLEDIFYVRKYALQADEGKQLTKDNKNFVNNVVISENELNEWKEV